MKRKRKKTGMKKNQRRNRPPDKPLIDIGRVLAAAIEDHQQGRTDKAGDAYRMILKVDPGHADANHLLGVIAYQTGDPETAGRLISKALETDSGQALYHLSMGNVLQERGLTGEAIDAYDRALAIKADFPEALNNAGNAHNTAGRPEKAVEYFQKALALRPDYVEAHNNLGNALKGLKRHDQAVGHLRRAIALNPAYAEAHNNLAMALVALDQLPAAAESCRRAIALKPGFTDAHVNLGVIYQKMGRRQEGLAAVQKAVAADPASAAAHTGLANALRDFGRLDEALAGYARAIELDPDCEEAHSNNLMTLHYAPAATGRDMLAAATAWAEPYNADIPEPDFANAAGPDRRLRIGYVSADFSRHPVGFYLERILPFHDRDAFEIIGYCNSAKSDDVTGRLRAATSAWRNVAGLSDEAMVSLIREDAIDILVDLSGHTGGHRLGVFAERPAPVQVTWMGYTGTTGLKAIDYIIADGFVAPDGENDLFTETPVRLPGCYLCFDPPRFDITPAPPPAEEAGFVTFGSFNNRIKITDRTIAAWSRILQDVAGSRLLLKTTSLDDATVRRSLVDEFGASGIGEERLLIEGRSPRAELLQAYRRVDIALDTMPFGGGVTTAEALWMGVPVISMASPRWSGRLGQTILNGVGLPELVAADPDHYHQLAVSLAADRPRLQRMHGQLRDMVEASPFCDGVAFAGKLEDAYRKMWRNRSSAPPDIGKNYAAALDHHQNGRTGEAAELYRRILDADGDHLASLHNLGLIVMGEGDPERAAELFGRALAAKPDYDRAHDSMGMALFLLGRPDEAVDSFRRSIAVNPAHGQTHFNLGNALREKGLPDEALASFRQAARLNPNNLNAVNNMAVVLLELNRPQEAAACLGEVLAAAPEFAEGHFNLGNARRDMGLFEPAADSYRRALAVNPDYDEAHSSLIFIQDHIAAIDQAGQQAERRRWNDRFIAPLADKILPHANDRNPDRRLRIGYVSADFHNHSACIGFGQLIADFERRDFEVFCYDATVAGDKVNQDLRAAASGWRRIRNMDDETLARTIREDAIDILVDLSGHTRGNRLKVFGHKPAPVQFTGIGHLPAGISTIDYRLTTDLLTPVGEEEIYPEKPVYLDTCFGFTPPRDGPAAGPLPMLENGHVTFGFLGRFSKVSEPVLALWARILRDIPGSRLLLKYVQLDDPAARRSITDAFSALGIGADRLILLGKTGRHEHLAAHNRVDMVFDTFPHCGGMTTMDSLWMGVPAIGLFDPDKAGGRILKSICRPLGLAEWVAKNADQYHAIAVDRAGDGKGLAGVRRDLRQRVLDVYSRFPREVEKSYRLAWRRWCDEDKTAAADGEGDYAAAVDLHRQGRTAEAAAVYRRLLESDPDHIASLHNLGVIVMGEGDAERAVALFGRTLALKPDYARAHDSMGMALFQMGRPDEAIDSFRRSIDVNPAHGQTHFNLGNALREKGLLDEALASYRQAARLNPNNLNAVNNMAVVLLELNRPQEAAACLGEALAAAPEFAEGHFTLGNACREMGRHEDAVTAYRRAIELQPDYHDAWQNLGIAAKLHQFDGGDVAMADFDPAIQSGLCFATFRYALATFRPHQADDAYDAVIDLMPKGRSPSMAGDGLPGRPVALLHFGRSGTGLMHSLIDGHPEISTMPGIYLSGYFNEGVWDELSAGGGGEIAARFAAKFEVLFDAASTVPVPGADPEGLSMIGFKEGMTTVGENRDKVLKVDREAFCAEAERLIEACCGQVDAGMFLRIAHAAYEHALGSTTGKQTLFYHIHNPNTYAAFNFLTQMPDARLVMMIRDPVASLESWVREAARDDDSDKISRYIVTTLFAIDQVAFRRRDCIGVRLEDLKSRPEKTLRSLCEWIGVEESPSLYEMTAQGEKWWGDQSSPDYDAKKEMSPFEDTFSSRPAGSVFGERDLFVLETLFSPFKARFGYGENNPDGLKRDLGEAREILDGLLDFEQMIIGRTGDDPQRFRRREERLKFRAALTDRLDVIEEFGTYPHMLKPLAVERD